MSRFTRIKLHSDERVEMTFSTDFYRDNRQYLPEYFGLYAILRSHSVQLQLSPFKPESFLAAIGNVLQCLPTHSIYSLTHSLTTSLTH